MTVKFIDPAIAREAIKHWERKRVQAEQRELTDLAAEYAGFRDEWKSILDVLIKPEARDA